MIYSALGEAAKFFRGGGGVSTDIVFNAIHYRIAAPIFLIFSILSGLTSWYSPIQCTGDASKSFETGLINQFCYAHSTFAINDANPGGIPFVGNSLASPSTSSHHVYYYKWVTMALALQAVGLYLPHFLWKIVEGKRVERVVTHYTMSPLDGEDRHVKINALANQLIDRKHVYEAYFARFAFCQMVYLASILAQFYVLHHFLDGHFLGYGPGFISESLGGPEVKNLVFPKQTMCNFRPYGPGGDPQKLNYLCLLAMNVLYEKLYLIVWFIMMFNLAVALIQGSYIILVAMLPAVRVLNCGRSHLATDQLRVVYELAGLNGWLILQSLNKHFDSIIFEDLVQVLHEKLLSASNNSSGSFVSLEG